MNSSSELLGAVVCGQQLQSLDAARTAAGSHGLVGGPRRVCVHLKFLRVVLICIGDVIKALDVL